MNRLFRALAVLFIAIALCNLDAYAAKIVQPSSGGSGGSCSGDINAACSQVTGGSHLAAGTVPNAALVTTPITACSGDINAACSQVTSGAHLGAATVPNASLVTTPITACSGDINAACSQVTSGSHLGAGTVPNASLVTTPITACSGDVNAACSQVTSGAHLGAATVPGAAVSGWPVTAYQHVTLNANNYPGIANTEQCVLFAVDAQHTASKISVNVAGTDAVNSYDFCLYNSTGSTLIANRGAGTMPSSSVQAFSFLQGTVTYGPGTFWMCWTGNATTASIKGTVAGEGLAYGTATGGAAGACASTITPPTIAPTVDDITFNLF